MHTRRAVALPMRRPTPRRATVTPDDLLPGVVNDECSRAVVERWLQVYPLVAGVLVRYRILPPRELLRLIQHDLDAGRI